MSCVFSIVQHVMILECREASAATTSTDVDGGMTADVIDVVGDGFTASDAKDKDGEKSLSVQFTCRWE